MYRGVGWDSYDEGRIVANRMPRRHCPCSLWDILNFADARMCPRVDGKHVDRMQPTLPRCVRGSDGTGVLDAETRDSLRYRNK